MGQVGITDCSQVIEIGSNDGYLLQYFMEKDVPVLGIEPAENVAQVAEAAGIPTIVKFFGVRTATDLLGQSKQADLLIGNNVLAHVPDINDFVRGLKILLTPCGVLTMEFHHLMRLIEGNQFDTIYHEHFSYLSLMIVEKIFSAHGLVIFDVEQLPTHGGSLRIYGRNREDETKPASCRVQELIDAELRAGLDKLDTYLSFEGQVRTTKRELLKFLIQAKDEGKSVVGYGAPAKGNTLLNYCGIGSDFIDYTVDRNPYKTDRYLPGNHIPIHHPDIIRETKPDYLLILPWNLRDEIMEQMACIRDWGGRFVVPIPEMKVYA